MLSLKLSLTEVSDGNNGSRRTERTADVGGHEESFPCLSLHPPVSLADRRHELGAFRDAAL